MYIGIDASFGAREMVRQIRLARSHGANGIAVFSFGAADAAGVWPVLASGVFSQVAAVPTMPWKHAVASDVASGTPH